MPVVSKEKLLWACDRMMLIRAFEDKVHQLIPQHRLPGFAHLSAGQEAVAVGVCAHLDDKDFVTSTHRGHGHCIAKGLDVGAMMAELYGKRTGSSKGKGGSFHIADLDRGMLGTNGIVGAGLPLACGPALVAKVKGTRHVAASFFGEGATNQGAFHEALNLAAVWKLPVLFVCENNLYSSHMHISERRAKDNIYKSGEAHGMPGLSLDGNDVVAVYRATVEAVHRARKGEGPTLLECRTYRWRGHVGPAMDMDVGVKRKDELKDWLPKDPIARTRTQLVELGMTNAKIEELERDVRLEIQKSIRFARESSYPPTTELRNHVFVDLRAAN